MRRTLTLCIVVLLGAVQLPAQNKAKAENVPVIPHTSVPNFFKLPPDLYFGEGIGIATNSKGNVFVYHRSGDTRLFEFDSNGNFVKEWGIGVYGLEFAHQPLEFFQIIGRNRSPLGQVCDERRDRSAQRPVRRILRPLPL